MEEEKKNLNQTHLIRISEMANMHGISRQTLILYDKQDIFKPIYVSESGYRYYSVYQIPYLREICFLRKLNMPLERIKEHMHNRNAKSARQMLEQLNTEIEQKIAELESQKMYIQQRLQLYSGMEVKIKNVYQPYIQWYPETKVIFVPFEHDTVEREELHLTLMKAWDILQQNRMVPSKGFGALLRLQSLKEGNYLHQAGSIVLIPFPDKINGIELYTIPEGEYVTMYKFGMPYDLEPVKWLVEWTKEEGYQICGDIVDLCLMDTTFYTEKQHSDFCQLRIPIQET